MNKEDKKHIRWLFRSLLKGFFTLDIGRVKESYLLMKLHKDYTNIKEREVE